MLDLLKFEQIGLRFWRQGSALVLLLVGALDMLTGSEMAFALFYLLPIAVATWFGGRNAGLFLCVCSAAVWLLADVLGDPSGATGLGLRV